LLGDTDSPSGEVRRILEWGTSCSRPLLCGEEEEEERELEEERVADDGEEEGGGRGGEVEEGNSRPSTSSPDSDSIDFLLAELPVELGAVGIRDGLVGSLLGAGTVPLEPIMGIRLAELVLRGSATSLAGLHLFLMSGILLFLPPRFSLLTS